MKNILAILLFAGACSKGGSDCDKIFDKTVGYMPAEMQSQIKDHKDDAIAKCEKMSPEAKSCAMAASSMEELMKCPKK